MTKRSLLTSLIAMVIIAVAGVGTAVATSSAPTLGLDLQGGFSVVLQAKEVNGRLPAEDSVEKAKDIIRQRVDGLGVAEPDITRQGPHGHRAAPRRQEPGEGRVARGLHRPPRVPTGPEPADRPLGTRHDHHRARCREHHHERAGRRLEHHDGCRRPRFHHDRSQHHGRHRPGRGGPSASTAPGAVGLATGEGALPSQFAPTTTIPPTTAPPSTVPDTTPTTVTEPGSSTTVPGDTTTTTLAPGTSGTSSSCSDGGTTAAPVETADGTQFPGKDGTTLYTLGPVGFTGEALSSANAALRNGQWTINVAVKNSSEAVANTAFNACYNGAATCPPQGQGTGAIAIVLDGEVLSAPAVNGPDLASGQDFTISGDFSEGEAKDLALVLRYGSLPVEFEQAALQQVSATLGADSLRAGLIAGLIGVAALAVYMVLYYRGFGLVVVVSLLVWAGIMYALVCLLSATQGLALTLAGITGVIVSVGTTVDTYVVVFERIKDEIRNGRSVRSATERGYKSGINTVFTANGAAFIGAFLLWYLTVGPVRGFAYFLGISVILDLAVAVFFTRPLILLLSRSSKFANARFFGIGTSTDQVARPRGAKAVTS